MSSPLYSVSGVKIGGIAAAVPAESVPLTAFDETFGREPVAKFSAATGIKALRRAAENQTASDLSLAAAERLLSARNIPRREIGLLIFASLSPDYRRPATACILQNRLRLSAGCGAFDLGLGCSAYPYALIAAASLLASSDARCALVLAGETMTKNTDPCDSSTAMLFGDAGSCTLLEKEEDAVIQGILKTDGEGYRDIIVPAGGFRNPLPAAAGLLLLISLLMALHESHGFMGYLGAAVIIVLLSVPFGAVFLFQLTVSIIHAARHR